MAILLVSGLTIVAHADQHGSSTENGEIVGQAAPGQVQSRDILVTFVFEPLGPVPPTYEVGGVTFEAHPSSIVPEIGEQGMPSERGYRFPHEGVTVTLPEAAESVQIRLCLFHSDVKIEPVDDQSETLPIISVPSEDKCVSVPLMQSGGIFSRVRFTGGGNEASIVGMKIKRAQ